MRERIQAAATIDELVALLDEGSSRAYAKASNRTRKQWAEAANNRREELLHELVNR